MSRHPPRGGGGGKGLEDLTRKIAAAALGLPETSLVGYFMPFHAKGITGHDVGAAGAAGPVTGNAQKLRLTSSATPNSLYTVRATPNAAANPKFIPTGAAKKWWLGGVFSRVDAVGLNAGDAFGLYLSDAATGSVGFIGGRQASSATNFTAALTNGGFATIDSGVAFDQSRRLHEFWRDGSTGNYRLNLASNLRGSLGAPVQGALSLGANATFGIVILNGAGGTNYACEYEWVAAWGVQE